jgi:predicted PolB exonuclease-like 3'-5' exonuclease
MIHRAFKYRIRELIDILPSNRNDKRIIDLPELFYPYSYKEYISFDNLSKYLGFKGKDGMDGSKVYDYFIAGKLNEIYEYCIDDVNGTYSNYIMMRR